jgi:hypothetical protein
MDAIILHRRMYMKKKLPLLVALTVFLIFARSGCVPGDGTYTAGKPAGFFWGIWHGWVAPVSLIIGIFNHSIRIYEPVNTGWWYDFGFYMAIISGFGGLALSRRKRGKRYDD